METSIIIETIVKVVIVLAVFSALAGFTTYIERKI
jgi:NADH-quinone oxidoreductase subunit H